MSIIGRALEALGRTLAEEGKEIYHQVLLLTLRADRPTYARIAEELGLSTHDVTNFLHRARSRLRQEMLTVVLETVSTVAEAEEELTEIFSGFPKGGSGDPSSRGDPFGSPGEA